jgi:hypothetical protein
MACPYLDSNSDPVQEAEDHSAKRFAVMTTAKTMKSNEGRFGLKRIQLNDVTYPVCHHCKIRATILIRPYVHRKRDMASSILNRQISKRIHIEKCKIPQDLLSEPENSVSTLELLAHAISCDEVSSRL